jgi:hypothetical protein
MKEMMLEMRVDFGFCNFVFNFRFHFSAKIEFRNFTLVFILLQIISQLIFFLDILKPQASREEKKKVKKKQINRKKAS